MLPLKSLGFLLQREPWSAISPLLPCKAADCKGVVPHWVLRFYNGAMFKKQYSYFRVIKSSLKQECIAVGCVPPALYRGGGVLPDKDPPGQRHPGQRPPPWTETTPWTETPLLDRDPPGQRPPSWTETSSWTETPPYEQNDWQTGLKTLLCRNFVAGGKN